MDGKPVRLEEVKKEKIRIEQEDLQESEDIKDQVKAGTVIPFKKT